MKYNKNIINIIIEKDLSAFESFVFSLLEKKQERIISEARNYVCSDIVDEILAEEKSNSNIQKLGRITKVKRRIRRNKAGNIVVQRNIKKSGLKGYRITGGNTVKRISAVDRIRKARKLKRSWKTTRRAKLKRTLIKRKMSMRRRAGIGLK